MDEIINKVAQSGLETIDLEDFYPQGEIVTFDMKDYLFMGMILKEKDFRASMQALDWEQYRGKNVGLVCTADAVIPLWAYMLVMTNLEPVANYAAFGDADFIYKTLYLQNLAKIDLAPFHDKRIVIKGCGDKRVGEVAYAEITRLLRPVAKSIMYGEPCSTVPVYKKKV
ncbi:Protein of unknown function [Chitinophaga terrae (ex Kim and Jung 2007)]|uniref:DUF2480 family protein n=1 Tax=Chitinophaga terrae (ex Kim and Jung 2007) TaxID=408074 RepID=A0A1H4E9R5_9BACT|nr:DUF2480 family protein [Chitinophaga terrae (ex Kim and Jung 2007)]GEP91491.1 hypothetical protein CTE07_31360 [Chitinophaga terrae (ex Kim and Jung 2007)]SEA81794.1 Protein of unknown function [Chitinophaga terrae (ex Kim and Jung 2007)]